MASLRGIWHEIRPEGLAGAAISFEFSGVVSGMSPRGEWWLPDGFNLVMDSALSTIARTYGVLVLTLLLVGYLMTRSIIGAFEPFFMNPEGRRAVAGLVLGLALAAWLGSASGRFEGGVLEIPSLIVVVPIILLAVLGPMFYAIRTRFGFTEDAYATWFVALIIVANAVIAVLLNWINGPSPMSVAVLVPALFFTVSEIQQIYGHRTLYDRLFATEG